MKKCAILLALALCWNLDSKAASTTFGFIDPDNRDLVIEILDDPGDNGPRDAALLWDALKGFEASKKILTESLAMECKSLETQPSANRSGSCQIVVHSNRVRQLGDSYGALFSGPEGETILKQFQGADSVPFPISRDLKLASGQLLITVDQAHKLFAMRIMNELMQEPALLAKGAAKASLKRLR